MAFILRVSTAPVGFAPLNKEQPADPSQYSKMEEGLHRKVEAFIANQNEFFIPGRIEGLEADESISDVNQADGHSRAVVALACAVLKSVIEVATPCRGGKTIDFLARPMPAPLRTALGVAHNHDHHDSRRKLSIQACGPVSGRLPCQVLGAVWQQRQRSARAVWLVDSSDIDAACKRSTQGGQIRKSHSLL